MASPTPNRHAPAVLAAVASWSLTHTSTLYVDTLTPWRHLLRTHLATHVRCAGASYAVFRALLKGAPRLLKAHPRLLSELFPVLLQAAAWSPHTLGDMLVRSGSGLGVGAKVRVRRRTPLYHGPRQTWNLSST